ncbi:unnamed protein product [Gongylonema pulchrum]|uniref:Ald_Xan_dh_C2 domain-containing protein n=1 Tax=Gongylonema pulchrum TaxID=637853 RepID=A0A183EZM8_9BILA|nr:unnamed protein product [Gongylonema pulchrum]VDN45531.1 unnamed protein product [Gongylonema pulchrum]
MIPLKTLLWTGKILSGTLEMKSVRDGSAFAAVEYDMNVSPEMITAITLQKVKINPKINEKFLPKPQYNERSLACVQGTWTNVRAKRSECI